AAMILGVDMARTSNATLGEQAKAQMSAAEAVRLHEAHQKALGEQIISTTQIQLKQIELMGQHQERMGGDIVSAAKITLNVEANEGKHQEQLGKRVNEEFAVSQRIAQDWVDSYMIQENAATQRFQAEMDAEDHNQEHLGKFILTQSIAAQKVTGFWKGQLQDLVASNKFSVGLIANTWTAGIANSIVHGGNFVKQAWESTQVAIIQG